MAQSRERDDKLIYRAAQAQDQHAINSIKVRSSVNVDFGDDPALTQLAVQGEKEQKAIDFLLKNGASPFEYAHGLGLGGHVQLAKNLRDSFKHPLDQHRVWATFISGYAQGEYPDLDELIQEDPSKFIIRCQAAKGLARQGKLESSRLNSWLKDAYKDNLEQADELLSCAMIGYARAANLPKCQFILDKARNSKKRATLLNFQYKYLAISNAIQEILVNTKNPTVKLEILLHCAEGYCCVGNLTEAIHSYKQAKEECGPLTAKLKLDFLIKMVYTSATWGHISNSVEISKLAEPAELPILVDWMAGGLAQDGMDVDQILYLVKPTQEQRHQIFNTIAFNYASAGTTISIRNLLQRPDIPNDIIYSIISGYASEGQATTAIQLINEHVQNEQQRADTYSHLIDASMAYGYISQAATLFEGIEHNPLFLSGSQFTAFSSDDFLEKCIKCPDPTFLTAVAKKAQESKDFKEAKEKPDLHAIILRSQKINQARQLQSMSLNQAHAASDPTVRCLLVCCIDTTKIPSHLFRHILSFLLPEQLEENEIKELAGKLKWNLGVKQPVIIALQKYYESTSAFFRPFHTRNTRKLIEECKKAKTPSDLVKALPDLQYFDAENKGFTGVARQVKRLRSLG